MLRLSVRAAFTVWIGVNTYVIAGYWIATKPLFSLREEFVVFFGAPIAALAVVLALDFLILRKKRISRSALYGAACVGAVLVAVLTVETVRVETGLWRENAYHESHFCNCMLRDYYVPWTVGAVGVFVSTVAYLAMRDLIDGASGGAPRERFQAKRARFSSRKSFQNNRLWRFSDLVRSENAVALIAAVALMFWHAGVLASHLWIPTPFFNG